MTPALDPSRTDSSQYRLTWTQLASPLFLTAVVLAPGLVDRGRLVVVWTSSAVVLVVLDALLLVGLRSAGVDLDDSGALVRGVRRRRVRWDDVESVEVEWYRGRQVVTLVEATRRSRLRAPTTGPMQRDARFDDKAKTIRWWWVTHRSQGAVVPTDLTMGSMALPSTASGSQPRSVGQKMQLALSVLLGVYLGAILLLVLVALVTGAVVRAVRIAPSAVVAGVIICSIEPVRSRLQRRLRSRSVGGKRR